MKSTAEAVVIGAGSFGSSLAYHLAAQGLEDVVLLDRFDVGGQTSPRAAGLTQQIRRERETTLLAKLSVEKFVRFTEETDIPLEFHPSGSVKMARDEAGVAQVEWEIRAGKELGLDIRPMDADEFAARVPWARTDGVLATACWRCGSPPAISSSNRARCRRSTPPRPGPGASRC
ncbi:MAG: hypothetical protein K0S78_4669 [Thermomicrobiales bacterium]|nr:hypothetical protein [Thermomicrobiales bacterium]